MSGKCINIRSVGAVQIGSHPTLRKSKRFDDLNMGQGEGGGLWPVEWYFYIFTVPGESLKYFLLRISTYIFLYLLLRDYTWLRYFGFSRKGCDNRFPAHFQWGLTFRLGLQLLFPLGYLL